MAWPDGISNPGSDEASEPDPRPLGGATGVVLTDTRDFPLVLCIGWDGACDIKCDLPHKQAAGLLRLVADQIENKPDPTP